MTGLKLGAHMSISGGIYRAVERGRDAGCRVIQIFSRQTNQWKAKALTEEDKENLIDAQVKTGVEIAAIHDSYLINLASPDNLLWGKSVEIFIEEIERAGFLGVPNLVFHPGSHLGAGEKPGIEKVASALNYAFEKTSDKYFVKILIETTAGQGTNLGWKFEHIRDIIDSVDNNYRERLGVCVDTCHIFAAGYDITTFENYTETMNLLDNIIGIGLVGLFHINDSKKPINSRVDRHEHIGKGFLGEAPFRFLLNDKRFAGVPMILETPKEDDLEDDRINLKTLRSLVAG